MLTGSSAKQLVLALGSTACPENKASRAACSVLCSLLAVQNTFIWEQNQGNGSIQICICKVGNIVI